VAVCGGQHVRRERHIIVAHSSIEGDRQGIVDVWCRCSRSQGEVVLDPRCNLLDSLISARLRRRSVPLAGLGHRLNLSSGESLIVDTRDERRRERAIVDT